MTETTPATSSPSKPKIRYTGGTTYAVQSRTRPERTHHTDVYHLTCDCEAGSRGKRCWALALAISFDAWRRQEGKKARVAEQHAHASSAPVTASAPSPAALALDGAGLVERLASAQGLVGPTALATARRLRDEMAQREAAAVPAAAGDFHQSAGYLALSAAFE